MRAAWAPQPRDAGNKERARARRWQPEAVSNATPHHGFPYGREVRTHKRCQRRPVRAPWHRSDHSQVQYLPPARTRLRRYPTVPRRRQADVRNLVRATYPELFKASAKSTPVLVTLLMNQDGTLYKSFKEDIEP